MPDIGGLSRSAPPSVDAAALPTRGGVAYRRGRAGGRAASGASMPLALFPGSAGADCSADAVSSPIAPPLLVARLMPPASPATGFGRSTRSTDSAAEAPFASAAPSPAAFARVAAASSRTAGSIPPDAESRTNQLSRSVFGSDPALEPGWRSIDQSPAGVAYRRSSAPVYAGIV